MSQVISVIFFLQQTIGSLLIFPYDVVSTCEFPITLFVIPNTSAFPIKNHCQSRHWSNSAVSHSEPSPRRTLRGQHRLKNSLIRRHLRRVRDQSRSPVKHSGGKTERSSLKDVVRLAISTRKRTYEIISLYVHNCPKKYSILIVVEIRVLCSLGKRIEGFVFCRKTHTHFRIKCNYYYCYTFFSPISLTRLFLAPE